METAVEEMIVETFVGSGEASENSMHIEGKIESMETPVSRVEENVEAREISSGIGKPEEKESGPRVEGGTTSLALLAEAYDSSDSESEEISHGTGSNEEVFPITEENKEVRHSAEDNKVACCTTENEKIMCVAEEIEEVKCGTVENKEVRHSAEETQNCQEENRERNISNEDNKESHNSHKENKERYNSEEQNEERYDSKEENSKKEENDQLQNIPETAANGSEDTLGGTEYRNDPRLSSDSSSDEDSDSDSDIKVSSSAESDSEGETTKTSKKNENNGSKVREKEMKGEYDNLPPIEELKISVPEVLCDPLGEVGWMVEQMVVVKPKPGKPTLNIDTILFVERGRRVLGRIFDVFGQVSEPHYCVRFNSSDHIEKSEIRVGMIVYFCPNTEYTSVVFLNDLLKMKATEEIGDDEHPEFSDDEEERAYYAALKQKQRNEKAKASEVPQKRQRTAKDGQESGWRSNHPWSTGKKPQGRRGARANHARPNGGEWPANQERNTPASPNFRQYGAPGANEQWPIGNAYTDWRGHPNQAPMMRPYFRPAQPYAADPYSQNSRFPIPNFAWQSQIPPASPFSWPFPPPPPPPPAI